MGWRTLLAVALLLGTAAIGRAQDGLRSASLPERPIATPPAGPEDRFRARPETYVPHQRHDRDRPESPHHQGGGLPVYGFGGWWPYVELPGPPANSEEARRRQAARDEEGERDRTRDVEPRTAAPGPVAPAPVAAPAVSAPARTFYVIPRCYAGDRPPDPSVHCDRTKLRTIR